MIGRVQMHNTRQRMVFKSQPNFPPFPAHQFRLAFKPWKRQGHIWPHIKQHGKKVHQEMSTDLGFVQKSMV